MHMKKKKSCYLCKFRQREVQPVRQLVCVLNEKIIDKDDCCGQWELRWDEYLGQMEKSE